MNSIIEHIANQENTANVGEEMRKWFALVVEIRKKRDD